MRPSSQNTLSDTILPQECSSHILSFLELKDVVRLGRVSVNCMKEVLPDLCRRRYRMNQQFAYWRKWKVSKGPELARVIPWVDQNLESWVSSEWVKIPSVEKHVEHLWGDMSPAHPLYPMVCDLRQELHKFLDESAVLCCPSSFVSVFSLMKAILRPLRLHACILSQAMHSSPMEQADGSTSLDQYMGDVLALTFLLNSSDLGIVEGGPTIGTCVRELRQRQPDKSSCYRYWVYVHSSILRVKTFTSEQQRRLGVPGEFCKVSEMIPNDCYINETFMSSEMILTFYEFGRLGPAFRGRDVAQVREIAARCLFAFFVTDNVNFQGETTRSALEWLCLVHEQTRQVRPMNVQPPIISLCRPHQEL